MKRDWDVIRKILIAIEESTDSIMNSDIADTTAIDAETVGYHCKLLIDAGLIEGNCTDLIGAPVTRCLIHRLTWAGHEFLDQIRQPKLWNAIKATAKSKSLDLSFDVLKAISSEAVKGLIS